MHEVEQSIQFVPHLANKRFFTVPKFGKTFDEAKFEARLIQPEQPKM